MVAWSLQNAALITNALASLDSLACNAQHTQECVLADILTANAHTEYICSLGLGGSTAIPEAFKRVAPIITYSDIKPLIARIVDGDHESPILTAQPISLFLMSSGTSSGQHKFIPAHDDALQRMDEAIHVLPSALLARALQDKGLGEDNAPLILHFLFVRPEFTTPGGLPVRTALTSICKGAAFCAHAQTGSTTPLEVLHSKDLQQSMYCQLLCGLIRRSEVGHVFVPFPPGLLRIMHFLKERWQELVEDIRTGILSKSTVSDPIIRASVEALISASGGSNRTLADELEKECVQQPRWEGIIRRLWPKAKSVITIVTGSMSQYISMLEFYTGGLPLVTLAYASSECFFGVNLAPLCAPSNVSYMLLPNMAYFEFLPVSNRQDHPQTPSPSQLIDLVNVRIGEDYELVITTYAGLYRYRVGDVLRVIGFHKKAPLFQFVRRANVLLSIDSDKTHEETLQRAVEVATKAYLEPMGWCVLDYTSYADISTAPGHYVLFFELQQVRKIIGSQEEAVDTVNLEACCLEVEENLDVTYKRGRAYDKLIGALEIRVVEAGTFDAVMELVCVQEEGSMGGASVSQYKTPRCVKKEAILELLNSRVFLSAFSSQCPLYTIPLTQA